MKDDDDWVSAVVEALQARILNRGRGNRLRLEALLNDAVEVDGSKSEVSGAGAHWYRRRWDGPDGDEPDRGPCTTYLETTAGGRFLRKLRTCDAAGSFATTTAGWPSGTSGGVALTLRVG
jgi:hypothetical protein